MLYVADSESESVSRNHDGWKRGIRIGSVKDGKVLYFIPDPVEKATGTSAAEGVAVDAQGNVYGAEVGPRALKKVRQEVSVGGLTSRYFWTSAATHLPPSQRLFSAHEYS